MKCFWTPWARSVCISDLCCCDVMAFVKSSSCKIVSVHLFIAWAAFPRTNEMESIWKETLHYNLRTINFCRYVLVESLAPSRLGARARTLCPGTKRNAVQTPWCPKFCFSLLRCCHLVTIVTSNHRETWVKAWHWWNLVQTSARARVRCLNTTFGESARTRVPCSSFCTGTTKMLRSHWCPCPSTEPGHQV